MLQLLQLIATFVSNFFQSIGTLVTMFFESLGLFYSALALAPSFLVPILSGMIAVAIVMWLVNLL